MPVQAELMLLFLESGTNNGRDSARQMQSRQAVLLTRTQPAYANGPESFPGRFAVALLFYSLLPIPYSLVMLLGLLSTACLLGVESVTLILSWRCPR